MNRSEDTAVVERELAAVEEALRTGRPPDGDTAERELGELALALRAGSPTPHAGFAERLRDRVAAGFPPPEGSVRARAQAAAARLRRPRTRPLRLPALRRPLPALGALASLLLALVIAVSVIGGGTDMQSGGGEPGTLREAPSTGASGDSAAPGSTAVPPPGPTPPDGGFDPRGERRIERSASLSLEAPADQLDRVADGISAVTERHDGFVLRSNVSSGQEGISGGSFELRIPAPELRPALRDLSHLGTVRSRSESGRDVTRQHAAAGDRLEAARAERRGLLRRLEGAGSDSQVEAIRRRLDLNAAEMRSLRSQIRDLRLRTDYAAVTVTLGERGGDSGVGPAEGMGDALDDALGSLTGALELMLRALGVLIPLGLLGVLAWLAARVLRRRRREAALF